MLVDASTLYSGLGWTGPPSDVLLKISGSSDYDLVLSDRILEELFRHLNEIPDKENALRSLECLKEAVIVRSDRWKQHQEIASKLVNDSKDAPVMAAFLTGKVDYLVTSDTSDFPVSEFDTVMTPGQFLEKA